MDLRGELLSFLEGSHVVLPDPFDDETPLLSSGTLDSLALFNLVLWVEEKTGRSIDPTQMDIVAAWDSVRLILRYVEEGSGGDAGTSSDPVVGHASGHLEVVPYGPKLKDAVARIQTGLWSPDEEANRRYLEWKHEENPYAGEPRMYLAMDGGEVVGMRSFYPSRWQVGQPTREVDLLVADDLLVRDDRRDEGIVTVIMRAAFEDLRSQGVEYVLNLTGGPVTILGSLAMGWRSAGSLDLVARRSPVRRARLALRNRMRSMRFVWRYAPRLSTTIEERPFSRFDERLGTYRTGDLEIELTDTPYAAHMASLARELGHDGRLRHVRDEEYLTWRFRHPFHQYRFAYARDDSLAGFLVLRWRPAGQGSDRRVYLADFQARNDRVLSDLLRAVLKAGRFPEMATWRATLSPAAARAVEGVGFEPVDQQLAAHGWPCILVRSVDDAGLGRDWTLHGTRLLDLASWDVRMLSTMAG